MARWEVIEVMSYGKSHLYISPHDKVDEKWLLDVFPKADIEIDEKFFRWYISNLPINREGFWIVLTALMNEGWEPFSWHVGAVYRSVYRYGESVTAVLRRQIE